MISENYKINIFSVSYPFPKTIIKTILFIQALYDIICFFFKKIMGRNARFLSDICICEHLGGFTHPWICLPLLLKNAPASYRSTLFRPIIKNNLHDVDL